MRTPLPDALQRLGYARRKCHSRQGCQQHQRKPTAAAPGMAGIMNPPQ
jgi:hypothetical protein